MRKIQLPRTEFRETLRRVGLIPEDTEFNRRAKEYAEYATKLGERRVVLAAQRKRARDKLNECC